MEFSKESSWWFYSLLLIPILLLSFLGTATAATNYSGENYLKDVTLHRTSGEGPTTGNEYTPNTGGVIDSIHENSTVRLNYEFEFPNNLALVAGDTLTVNIPSQMRIGDVSTPKPLLDGTVEIGTYTIANDVVTITMNEIFVARQDRTMFLLGSKYI